jgi:hypothetical protein
MKAGIAPKIKLPLLSPALMYIDYSLIFVPFDLRSFELLTLLGKSSRSYVLISLVMDRLCGLVVRVLDYGSEARVRFPALKKIVGLERGPLSLVSTTEELLDRKVAAPVQKTENTAVGIRHADHVAPFIRRSCQSLSRQAAVARSV